MIISDNVLKSYIEDTEPVYWIRSEHVNADFIKIMKKNMETY